MKLSNQNQKEPNYRKPGRQRDVLKMTPWGMRLSTSRMMEIPYKQPTTGFLPQTHCKGSKEKWRETHRLKAPPPRCSFTNEWVNLWQPGNGERVSGDHKGSTDINTCATRMNHESITLSERRQRQKPTHRMIPFRWHSGNGQMTVTKNKSVVSRARVEDGWTQRCPRGLGGGYTIAYFCQTHKIIPLRK